MRRRPRRLALWMAVLGWVWQGAASPAAAQCAVSSSFAADDEGWTVINNAGSGFDWIGSGGNPPATSRSRT